VIETLRSRVRQMSGRDPDESGRTASTLELMFDLTFVIAYGLAANELAHLVVTNEIRAAVVGFVFANVAISWAWINFTWFASAYDTDDWIYRLTTMLQMTGVLVLALGLPRLFDSLVDGGRVDNTGLVIGYVIMRVAMVLQWLRVARQDSRRRKTALLFAAGILVAQTGWVLLLLMHLSLPGAIVGVLTLGAFEAFLPAWVARRAGGSPWHPHHIAERYGLLVIIALGEGMIGTMASMSAIVGPEGAGWSLDFVLVGLAGVALTFGMWWAYFVIPSGATLATHRERARGWGYGHIVVFGAAVGVGAGLHAAGYYLERHSQLAVLGTVLATAIPLALFVASSFAVYLYLTRHYDPFHIILFAVSTGILLISVGMAAAGVSLAWCLVVLAATPWPTVIGYEAYGHARGVLTMS
jgi:low temperature requirement protein LtrA